MTATVKNSSPHHLAQDKVEILSWQKLLLKATTLSLVFVLIFILITVLAAGVFAYSKFSKFLSTAGLTFSESRELLKTAANTLPQKTNEKTTFLILGIDSVSNKQGAPPLTDTMLLMTVDYSTGTIRGLSLPRDLWSQEYKTKINALYYYGQERYPENPENFSKEVITQLTAVPINYTIVFSLSSISELVEILGGLTIDIPEGFVDTEFPREDIDITSATNSADLYETVVFKQGLEKMSADRVTKYIRSRHSPGDTGTDTNRANRQQLVISALIQELSSKEVLLNTEKLGQMYLWYNKYMTKYLPVSDALSIGKELYPSRNTIHFSTNSLSIYPDVPHGVLMHPPIQQTDNQWTYIIKNQQLFQSEIYDKLGL